MTTSLTAGANCAVEATWHITVSLSTMGAHADMIVLLLDAAGHADGDDGVVLFSHPVSGGGAVLLDVPTDTVSIELQTLPEAVERVLVVAQADGVAHVGECGTVTTLVRGDGQDMARFALASPPALPTVQLVEIYRRGDVWKVRALGDGYAAGLAKLLTVHGVEVLDDPVEPDEVDEPTAATTAAATPAAPPVAPAPTPASPVPAAPAPSISMVKPDLPSSGTQVDLTKGQAITLRKEGEALTQVRMGLGWDPATSGAAIDLDASCVLLDARGKKVDAVWFMRKTSKNGAIKHSGDNVTGKGAGDDEVINVDLTQIPSEVVLIAFTVNSFMGQPLSSVKRAYCNLRTGQKTKGKALVHYDLKMTKGKDKGIVMATLERDPAGGPWTMTARGDLGKGRTYKGLMGIIEGYLR